MEEETESSGLVSGLVHLYLRDLGVDKRVQQDTLDERIRRSRGGLAKMDED